VPVTLHFRSKQMATLILQNELNEIFRWQVIWASFFASIAGLCLGVIGLAVFLP
jgi:hypothetical protein